MCESRCWCGDSHDDDYEEWSFYISLLKQAVKTGVALTTEKYNAACESYDHADSVTYGMSYAASFEDIMNKYLLVFMPWNNN